MSGGAETDGMTIRGIVVPTHWGASGEVTRVAILTSGEGEYEVAEGEVGDRLMDHLQQEVLAQAVPLNGPTGGKRIAIRSFAVLDWNDSPETVVFTTLDVAEDPESARGVPEPGQQDNQTRRSSST